MLLIEPVQWPMAGRDDELRACAATWADPRTQGLFLFGPAGVGKSRLAEELLARAVQDGWLASRVTVTAAAAAVPLGAVAHLIPAGVDMSDPVRGFAAVARLLAGPRRRVILVDDLHLLDAASTVLLRQLLDAGVVRLIGTIRSGEPVSDAVDALTTGEPSHRIYLTEFGAAQLDQVLRAALGAPVGRRTLLELHAISRGNALYLHELVLGALAGGALASDGEIWELAADALPTTPRLAELIGNRLAAADPAAAPVLELLALCEPLPLADVRSVATGSVLAGLERSGLIQAVSHRRRTTVALAHPLYGEVLRAGLPTLRRRELLLAQAARTEAVGARRREDALHLATWYLAATGTADPALLVQAAAVARHAHDYQRVASLLAAVPEEHRTHVVCLMHGHASMQVGQWQDADLRLTQAQDSAADETETVAATLVRSWNLFWTVARVADALRISAAARAGLTSPVQRQVLAVNEAALRTIGGQPVAGLAGLADITADYQRMPDGSAWSVAAMAKTAGLAYVGRPCTAAEWGEQAYAAHLRMDEQELATGGTIPVSQLNPVIFALTDAGRFTEARTAADRLFVGAARTDAAMTWIWAACFRGRLEWLAGNAAAARRWYAEALAQARAQRYVASTHEAWAGLAAAAAVLGDLTAAEAALREMRVLPPLGHLAGEADLGQAWLCVAKGDVDQALAVLTAAAARARHSGHVSSEMMLLTDIARLGRAGDVVARLTELAGSCEGTLAPARAHLATALATQDPGQLLAVADELRVIGANRQAAEAFGAAAAVLRRTGQSRRATAAAQQARQYAALCAGVRVPLLTTSDATVPLSSREREIVLLAAGGMSSRGIAETLRLSVRTVDNHLQHAYTKLGVGGRRELAATIGGTPAHN
jgi:DNA-binding CsgD family transcriptional regulator